VRATTTATRKMPKWTKSPPELAAKFDAALPADSRVEKKVMFGYPAAFTGGNMFAGLWQDHVVVRLDEADRAVLRAVRGAVVFEPMKGRPMAEYTIVPPAIVGQPKELAFWLGRGLGYASSLPPKAAKPKKTAAARSAKKATKAKRSSKVARKR
jgi:hypothetical protein